MRARNLLTYGMAAAVAAACSNPSGDAASDPAADLLSELEPALFVPAGSAAPPVLSAAELAPDEKGETRRPAAPPRTAPARIQETAGMAEVETEVVQAVAHIHGDDLLAGPVAVAAGADHAGHDHEEEPSVGRGILIRGGVDTGVFGDPCIPGGHRPEQGPMAGVGGLIGRVGDASSIGPVGVMVNDQTPRIGRGELPSPRSNRGSSARTGTVGGMGGGGGRVFIR